MDGFEFECGGLGVTTVVGVGVLVLLVVFGEREREGGSEREHRTRACGVGWLLVGWLVGC